MEEFPTDRLPQAIVLTVALFLVGCAGCEPEGGEDTARRADDGASAGDVDGGPADGEAGDADAAVQGDADARSDAEAGDGADGGDVDGGCDTSIDTDADGLSDCLEARRCTSPTDGDTDGDHLSDFEEMYEHKSSPCDADTDGDGVPDDREVELGLDPTKRDTYGDGTPDDERWLVRACRSRGPRPVAFHTSQTGDWKVALPSTYGNYRNVTLQGTSAPRAAAVYGDPSAEIAAALVAARQPSGQSSPTEALDTTVRSAASAVGTLTHNVVDAAYRTHGGERAAHMDLELEVASNQSARRVRDRILARLAGVSPGRIKGLPSSAGTRHGAFRLEVGVVARDNPAPPATNLYTVAVVPLAVYDRNHRIEFRMGNLTDTTALSRSSARGARRCARRHPPKARQGIEFYFVLPQASAQGGYIHRRFYRNAPDALPIVRASTIDYRLGVTNIHPQNRGRLVVPPGWHRKKSTFTRQLRDRIYQCTRTNGWYCSATKSDSPLTAPMWGIQYMKGLTNKAPPTAMKIRDPASVSAILLTTGPPQGKHPKKAQTFLPNHSVVYTLIPLSKRYGPNGILRCDGSSIPNPTIYKDLARVSGGRYFDLCKIDVNKTLRSIFYSSIASGASISLPSRPIATTLRVYVDGTWVPRSRTDGFEYFPKHNKIALFGSFRPNFQTSSGGPPTTYAIHYRTYQPRCKSASSPTDCSP